MSCDMLFFAYIYCPKESKCHALARFVLFVRLVFEKNIFAYELYSVDHKSPESHEYIPCRNLKRFVRFVRLVFEKNIFAYVLYSVDHESPESNESFISRQNQKTNPS